MPKSPLIERQKFSAQEETELKHLCSLALANVPHSDDMMDDPFRYLGNHITAKVPPKPSANQASAVPQQPSATQQAAPVDIRSMSSNSTATPSETSKRETLKTNDTTPMTTPGLTPGDTDKRFSDGGKRSHLACQSNLKTEVKASNENTVYSFLKDPIPSTRPQVTATKSLTHLPALSKSKARSRGQDAETRADRPVISQPNFNKSLPAIPQLTNEKPRKVADVENTPKEKPRGITRMLRTVGFSRPHTAVGLPTLSASTTSAADPQLDYLNKLQTAVVANSSPKKHKFMLSSIFHKRSAGNNKRATVG